MLVYRIGIDKRGIILFKNEIKSSKIEYKWNNEGKIEE